MNGRYRFFDVTNPVPYKRIAAFLALRGDILEGRWW
jgi:hypothetical protein